MSSRGAPSRYSEELAEKVIQHILLDQSVSEAAQAAGLHIDTIMGWVERGAQGNSKYKDFAERYKKAQAQTEARFLSKVQDPNTRDWQRWAWMLERKWPNRWGRRLDITSAGEKIDSVDVFTYAAEVQKKKQEELLAKRKKK